MGRTVSGPEGGAVAAEVLQQIRDDIDNRLKEVQAVFDRLTSGCRRYLKIRAMYRSSRSAKRPLLIALAVGLVMAVAFTFLVPVWTLTDPGALTGPIDYAFAFLFALVPASMFGSAVFSLVAMKCASRAKTA